MPCLNFEGKWKQNERVSSLVCVSENLCEGRVLCAHIHQPPTDFCECYNVTQVSPHTSLRINEKVGEIECYLG